MITRILYNEERAEYNSVIKHPVQTWEWGDFQISQGHKIHRLGIFNQNKIVSAYSVSFHHLPRLNFTIGTCLRGPKVNEEMIKNITKIARDENAVFVKLEPDIPQAKGVSMAYDQVVSSPKVAFFPYTFIIDLTKSQDELLSSMHPKTRYNIKVANRHRVEIIEDNSDAAFENYLEILFETTHRQGFFLHTPGYHRALWKTLKDTSMIHLLFARYQGKTLAAFMLFVLNDRIFYPYGATREEHRSVMAPNLLMWEAILLGKKLGCKSFDMWGCLGPGAREGDFGYGFHRFKQGYGGELVQYVGTYDLVINPSLYSVYNLIDRYRWKLLRLKAKYLKF